MSVVLRWKGILYPSLQMLLLLCLDFGTTDSFWNVIRACFFTGTSKQVCGTLKRGAGEKKESGLR